MEETLPSLLMRLCEIANESKRFSSKDVDKIAKMASILEEFEIDTTEQLYDDLHYG